MSLELPTRTDLARYSFDLTLDDVPLKFAFEWNDRDAGWYMSIADVNAVPLLSGRRIVIGVPLISIYRDTRLPPGTLVAIDTSTQDLEPDFADLGDRVKLLYVTRAELGL
jgi:hypothetical protein